MKKILVIFLVLISASVFAREELTDSTSDKTKEIIKKLKDDKVEFIVIGEVIDVEVNLFKRKINEELSPNNVIAVTTVSFEVKKAYKGNRIKKRIKVEITGGKFTLNNRKYAQVPNNAPHPLLNNGDIILMGLKKDGEVYKHVYSNELQIPFDDNLIDDIENQIENHKIKKLEKLQRNNQYSNNDYLSENEIREISNKTRNNKKALIHKLKIKLDEQFSNSEVINE